MTASNSDELGSDEFDLVDLDTLKQKVGLAFPFKHPSFGAHDIGVFWDGENVYAIENMCPHLFGALNYGRVRTKEVTCPLHGAIFDLETGKCIDFFTVDTTTYHVEVRDGRVWVTAPGEVRDE